MDLLIVFIRFALTFGLAIIFGLERQKSHKPIGFGTYLFVSMGACGLAMAAIEIAPDNPLSLLGSIVTGIGFLGAGALIKTTDKIFGFTTAASIWVFAIFGLLIGVGEYLLGIIVYSVIWVVIIVDRYLENRGIGSFQRRLVIKTNKIISEKEIRQLLLQHVKNYKFISLDIDKTNNTMTTSYLVEARKTELNKIPTLLYKADWLSSCKIE